MAKTMLIMCWYLSCHYIRQNQQFVTRNEMDLLTAKVGTITERQDRMENKVDSIQKDVTILADNFITDKDKKNFVIYKGQKSTSFSEG